MNSLSPVATSAILSPDGLYRYRLVRRWAAEGPALRWVMLNPSTADATTDDPTIRRCVRFAADWGYDAIVVHNLFALRATDPRELRHHPDPIGPDNDDHLRAGDDLDTVCAWGAHPLAAGRAAAVLALLGSASCLGLTKGGHPRHPLYVPAATMRTPMPERSSP